MQAGTRFTYPGGMIGLVDLVDLIAPRPGVELATFRSRVRHSTSAVHHQENRLNKKFMTLCHGILTSTAIQYLYLFCSNSEKMVKIGDIYGSSRKIKTGVPLFWTTRDITLNTATDGDVLCMLTVVSSPTRVKTVENVRLCSSTDHIIKPDLSTPGTVSISQVPSNIPNRTYAQPDCVTDVLGQ